MGGPSLKVLKARLNGILSNLVWWEVPCPWQRVWNKIASKDASNQTILWLINWLIDCPIPLLMTSGGSTMKLTVHLRVETLPQCFEFAVVLERELVGRESLCRYFSWELIYLSCYCTHGLRQLADVFVHQWKDHNEWDKFWHRNLWFVFSDVFFPLWSCLSVPSTAVNSVGS